MYAVNSFSPSSASLIFQRAPKPISSSAQTARVTRLTQVSTPLQIPLASNRCCMFQMPPRPSSPPPCSSGFNKTLHTPFAPLKCSMFKYL